ncbi:MAG: Toluene tolerance protein Ttg2D [uncultured bacterium]|nr:MAG: Toluene tolerance protein Ttg2D [uncultured bacterium]
MKKYLLSIITFLFLISLFSVPTYAGDGDPVGMLQSIANQLISALKANRTSLKENPSLVYSLARRIVVPHADLTEMSMRVLPPRTWNSATPGERARFQSEFTTLLVRTYASALAEYKDQTVKFYPVRGGYQGKSSVRVDSQIVRSNGPAISVNYRLVLKGSSWKLYDMTVEGVSMLESFRSQFADQLARSNMAELIKVLARHNSTLIRRN